MNGHANGDNRNKGVKARERVHPQTSFSETVIQPSSFFGRLRKLYSDVVLKTQLDQLRQQGSYDAFKLGWHPVYDVRRLHGAKTRSDRVPPSLFWESDVGKWIEAACYFLASPDGAQSSNAAEYKACIQELIDMMEKAQQPDGYLNIYFTVVDKAGKFKNLRAMHEMYNSGHLLEAALAHHQLTGSRQFLDIMIRNIDCYIKAFGPSSNQLHGYPGHPELELAVLRLYATTKDPKHLEFGRYLVAERGQQRKEFNGETYFSWEAREREDEVYPATLTSVHDHTYNMSYAPLPEQKTIQGHSVRAMYLLTAAADLDDFAPDAKRLWNDAVDHKMYLTGGLGTQPRTEGFHDIPYYLPQSTNEGGCYAETCASIGCMMVAERILSFGYDTKARDVLERCLYNNVIGGGSLNGKQFSYANKHATSGSETAVRNDWFEVCCCPPNLSRTLGMLGGYTWAVNVDQAEKTIKLDVYLLLSATRIIELGHGQQAKVEMRSEMPWQGVTKLDFSAPEGWHWEVKMPVPEYAKDPKLDDKNVKGEHESIVSIAGSRSIEYTFDMPVQLVSPHPLSNQDNLSVTRGPIVFVAEAVDNREIEAQYPHFGGVGLSETAKFTESSIDIEGVPVVCLTSGSDDVYADPVTKEDGMYNTAVGQVRRKEWSSLGTSLTYVPWFARANRGGNGHVRVAMQRVSAN